jgi:hypothetical protein
MIRQNLRIRSLVLILSSGLFAFSCEAALTSSRSGSARLMIMIENQMNSRHLAPELDMVAASCAVKGSGPEGASFSVATIGGTVTQKDLPFGSWDICVDACNQSGAVIGSGQASALLRDGATTLISISLLPIAGTGSLSLQLSWPATRLATTPTIIANLTPALGPAQSIPFSISGGTASFQSSSVLNGYYTLDVTLLDGNGVAVAGVVDIIRIVSGQATSGSYSLSVQSVGASGSGPLAGLNSLFKTSLNVSISGANNGFELALGSTLNLSATVATSPGNLVYVWYADGVMSAVGPAFSFGAKAGLGHHRIDLTAFTPDGLQGGSATVNIQVKS